MAFFKFFLPRKNVVDQDSSISTSLQEEEKLDEDYVIQHSNLVTIAALYKKCESSEPKNFLHLQQFIIEVYCEWEVQKEDYCHPVFLLKSFVQQLQEITKYICICLYFFLHLKYSC